MTSFLLRGLAALALALALVPGATADAPAGPTTVPDVVGLAADAAEAMVREAGFEPRIEAVEAAPGSQVGYAVSQDPGGLATRDAGTVVTIRVAGAKKAVEPAPVATRRSEPRAAPAAPPAPSEAPPSGTIPELPEVAPPPVAVPAAPEPAPAPAPPEPPAAAPGAPTPGDLPAEPGLDLAGPPLPNTFGMSRQEAERALAGYQLFLEVTLASADMQGRVVEQHPVPGQTLKLGQPVTLIFGLASEPGPEYRQVPALEGVTPEEATARLARAGGYTPVFCTVPSRSDQAGRVVDSTPHRFSFLLKGEKVRVRIGRGTGEGLPPPVTEPAPTPVPAPAEPSTPPSGELPSPMEPPAPVAPPPPQPPPSEPLPGEPPAGPLPAPAEPAPTQPPPAEPAPTEPPPTEPPPAEPPPAEPPPAEPAPAEPAPMPFPTQPPKPAPGTTRLSGPAEGDSFPKAYGPTFEWQVVANADGYQWVLEAEDAQGTWREVRTETLIGTKFRPARLEAARYRWRVRALNGEVPGEWTAWRRLYLY
jgi:beta-lactam-binding protein with PASTA domain